VAPDEYFIGQAEKVLFPNLGPGSPAKTCKANVLYKVQDHEKPFVSCSSAVWTPFGKNFGSTEVIVRRFHSEYCKAYPGQPAAELNALVIMSLTSRPSPDLTICYGTPLLDTEEAWPMAARVQVYDEKCGGPNGVRNGTRIKDWNGFLAGTDINPLSLPNIAGDWISNGNHGLYSITQSGKMLACDGASGPASGNFTSSSKFVMRWRNNTWTANVAPDQRHIYWDPPTAQLGRSSKVSIDPHLSRFSPKSR
jgi:hypothetical protein